jgi:hypothetical protein
MHAAPRAASVWLSKFGFRANASKRAASLLVCCFAVLQMVS